MDLPTLPLDQLHAWCSAHPTARVALLAPSHAIAPAPFADLLQSLPASLTVRRAVGSMSISWPNGALALVMTPHEKSWRGLSFDRLVPLVPRVVVPAEVARPSFAAARWVEPCPTCSGPTRETVGMVCQTCGTDYGATDEGMPLSVVVDRLREVADELDELLAAVHELRRAADGTHVVSRLIAQAWAHAIQAHHHARRIAAVDPLAVREP